MMSEKDFWQGYVPEPDKRQQALDKMAENARELGLDYEPPCKTGSQCTSKCQQCVVQEPDYKALWQQMCERCDELDKELSATDRQVEILSDALAESRREVAAPVQEPVACRTLCELCVKRGYDFCANAAKTTTIITPPAAQITYTKKDVDRAFSAGIVEGEKLAIEAQLPAAPVQEPVRMVEYNCTCGRTMKFESVNGVVAAQRSWFGLTDDEIIDLIHPLVMADMPDQATDYEIARAIEAKLKEKNT